MKPKITDMQEWQQAELLMQPALIRLIDNVRKQLEHSKWTGNYRTIESWPEGTPAEVQAQVTQLQQQLEATPEQAVELSQVLAGLPQPKLTYQLCLKRQAGQLEVDVWDLCYQICFYDYNPNSEQLTEEAHVDSSLIGLEGEVDWHRLDLKARQVVEQLFNQLAASLT